MQRDARWAEEMMYEDEYDDSFDDVQRFGFQVGERGGAWNGFWYGCACREVCNVSVVLLRAASSKGCA